MTKARREHIVKCLPPYFAAIRSGEKTFDVRRDDRGYQRGDFIVLMLIRLTQTGPIGSNQS